MKTTTAATSAENRKIKNYLLYPKVQLKYAALYTALTSILGIFLIGLQIMVNHQMLSQIDNPEFAETLIKLQDKTLAVQIVALLGSALIIFLITILTTHRFLGPIVAIIRHFEATRVNGPSEGQVSLRQEDELKPLVAYLKTMDIQVKQKDSQ